MSDFTPHSKKEKLQDAISRAKFYVQNEPLDVDGELKDAKNFWDTGEVYVTEKYCSTELIDVSGRAMSLLLHEYLGLARISDVDFSLSGLFLQKYSELLTQKGELEMFVVKEVEKDLQGKPSCLNGTVFAHRQKMQDEYGGRTTDNFTVQAVLVNSSLDRSPTESCGPYLDKNKKEVDFKDGVYRICDQKDITENVVSIVFSGANAGSREEKDFLFKVVSTDLHRILALNKPEKFPEGSDLISQKIKNFRNFHRHCVFKSF